MIALSRSGVLPFFALLVLFVVQMQVCAAPLVAAVDDVSIGKLNLSVNVSIYLIIFTPKVPLILRQRRLR